MQIKIIALCLGILAGHMALAETDSENREKMKRYDAQMKQRDDLVKAGVTTYRTLGFHQTSSLDLKPPISPETFHTQLVLRFSCDQKDPAHPLVPKFKNVKWKILDRDLKLSGESQTDGEGCLVIETNTDKQIATRKIEISVGSFKKVMEIGMGPKELFLNEENCAGPSR